MFQRRLQVDRIDAAGVAHPVPIAHLDSFSMRNFTNDAIFDDTLPVADGLLEAGKRIPTELLLEKMQDWFRRKSYLAAGESLRISELQSSGAEAFAMPARWPNILHKI
jgi:hypothetical protein